MMDHPRSKPDAGIQSGGPLFALRARWSRCTAWTLLAPALSGCGTRGVQSMLDPAGPAAAEIAWLWWFMFITGGAVLVATLVLLAVAVRRRAHPERTEPPLGSWRFVVLAGLLIPAVILIVLLVFTLRSTINLRMPETHHTIQVVGHQWWWEVRYPDHRIRTANEIFIPTGVPVRLELRAADVVHSLWIPRLHGKMDLMPEHVTHLWIQSDRPGTFWGQCGEYCGLQHAFMRIVVNALPPDAYEAWLERAARPVAPPATEIETAGQAVFMSACAHCHAISGTAAEGEVGPDLTHIRTRTTLGAGRLPNNPGNLYGWISDPQPLKPGNLMPPSYLHSEDLEAVVEYLLSLN